jgi:hypothetical protein
MKAPAPNQLMKTLLSLIFLIFCAHAHAQNAGAAIARIIALKPREIPKYTAKERPNVLLLRTGFNDADFSDAALLKTLAGRTILKAELVYTTYHKSENFDQHALNRKRLQALFAAAPEALKQPSVEWILVAQTGCTSAEEGESFFHGLVITLRDKPDGSLANAEADYLEAVMNGSLPVQSYEKFLAQKTKIEETAAPGKRPAGKTALPDFPGGERARQDYFNRNLQAPANVGKAPGELVPVQFRIDRNGKIGSVLVGDHDGGSPYQQAVKKFVESMPDWKPATVDGKPIDCVVRFAVDFVGDRAYSGPLEIFDPSALTVPEKEEDLKNVPMSPAYKSVSDALARTDAGSSALVCDVTASMAPYNAQTMLWLREKLKEKSKSPERIVFFNDGDGKPDGAKKAGSTGGLYSFVPESTDHALKQLSEAIRNGKGGGDVPENNIEALLAAQTDCPDCTSMIMIADNVATPRDLSLLAEVRKPVQIIVCSQVPSLNPVWLDIARATGGSVVFSNKTLAGLDKLAEGATVNAGRNVYVLSRGKFSVR